MASSSQRRSRGTATTKLALLGTALTTLAQSPIATGFPAPTPSTSRASRCIPSPLHLRATRHDNHDAPPTTIDDSETKTIDQETLSLLSTATSLTTASKILTSSLPKGSLYNSIAIPPSLSTRPISDAELAVQTRTIRSKFKIYELIEQNGQRDVDRASLGVACVFAGGSLSAILAQQTTYVEIFGNSLAIPEVARFVVVWLLSFSPLILVGLGLALPERLSSSLIGIQRAIFPTYRRRMVQHEAGHFLVGHLLGWPVKGYKANNAVRNAVEFYPLSDGEVGRERAELLGFAPRREVEEDAKVPTDYEERPYFSKEGRGAGLAERSVFRDQTTASEFQLPPKDDPKTSWPFRGFDEETLDKLAVISVAGACAEILAYGNAEGGVADLVQLRRIYGAAASAPKQTAADNGSFGSFTDDASERRLRRQNQPQTNSQSAKTGMDEKEMDNRTKFALGFATVLLRSNLGALDALAEAMERGGTVEECIVAIETCPDVSGATPNGDYDRIRRERFQSEQGVGGWIEKTLLGGGKTIDSEDSSVAEGRGGGERREGFRMTGDDPFYAAMALAFAFFAWASNGGLTLH